MRMDEVRGMTPDDLRGELERAKKELFNLRFQKATRQLADSTAIPKTRQTIARIHTALSEQGQAG